MKKDRFSAFFDAIMAIIMTIGVLGFVQPEGTNWSDLKDLSFQVLTYALSFFWLGIMWMNIHTLWHDVKVISKGVMLANLFMLFFASMIPFLTIYLGKNITAIVPQILYGIDVIIISVCNHISCELLKKYNLSLESKIPKARIGLLINISIIVIAIIIGLTVAPSAVMVGIVLALICVFVQMIKNRRNGK